MGIPNGRHVVERLAAQYPQEWKRAHNPSGGGPETEAFIRRLAWVLHSTVDQRFGLNGKRGNPNDISDDAICFAGESLLGDVDPTRGNAPVTVLDVIGGAGGLNPTPQWGAVGPATPQPYAAWVQPQPVGDAQPAPGPSAWTPAHSAELAKLGAPNGALDLAFTQKVAEHFAAVFPAEGWGQKKASVERPVSGDVVARRDGGRVLGYRVVPLPAGAPAEIDITGQIVVAVTPTRHAGSTPPPPVDPVDPVDPLPPAEPAVLRALAALAAELAAVRTLATEARDAAQAAEKAALDAKTLAEKLKGQKFRVKGLPSWFGNPTIEPQD